MTNAANREIVIFSEDIFPLETDPLFNPHAVEIGSIYRSWRIERPIGSGGMGVVYRAQHLYTPRKSAIKIIRSPGVRADQGSLVRFHLEAELHVTLRHPNLPDFYDADLLPDGTAILVLEWLDGYDLAKTLDCLPRLTLGDALFVIADVLRPLTVLHPLGIHRDIKPSNIFICRKPRFDSEGGLEKGRVRLCDFGIAKLNNRRGPTQEHKVVGTSNYMSPEQLNGDPLDPRSDLYAVGALLYEMLAGHPVFLPTKTDGPYALIYKHLSEPPPDLRLELPELPEDVWAFVVRLLQKKPGDRFNTTAEALEVARELRKRYFDASKVFRDDTPDAIALIDTLKEERWGLPPLPVSAAVIAARGRAATEEDPEAPTESTPAPPEHAEDVSRPISGVHAKTDVNSAREAMAVGDATDPHLLLEEHSPALAAPTKPSAVSPSPAAATMEAALASQGAKATDSVVGAGASANSPLGRASTEPMGVAAASDPALAALAAYIAQLPPHAPEPPPRAAVKRGTFRMFQGASEQQHEVEPWERAIVDRIRQLLHAPRCFVRPALVQLSATDGRPTRVSELKSPSARVDEPGRDQAPLTLIWTSDRRLGLHTHEARPRDQLPSVDGAFVSSTTELTHGAKLEVGELHFSVTDLAVWDPREPATIRKRATPPRLVYVHSATKQILSAIDITSPLTLIGSSPACDLVIQGVQNVRFAVWLRGDGDLELVTLDTSVMPYGNPIEEIAIGRDRDGWMIGGEHYLILLDPSHPQTIAPPLPSSPTPPSVSASSTSSIPLVAPLASRSVSEELLSDEGKALHQPIAMSPQLQSEPAQPPTFGRRPGAPAATQPDVTAPGRSAVRSAVAPTQPNLVVPPAAGDRQSHADTAGLLLLIADKLPSGFGRAPKDGYRLEGILYVGSAPDCDIVIDHPLVSPRHTKVTVGDGFCFFDDMASAKGTWVQGIRMASGYLQPGQRISFGGAATFVLNGPSMNAEPVPTGAPVPSSRPLFERVLGLLGIGEKKP